MATGASATDALNRRATPRSFLASTDVVLELIETIRRPNVRPDVDVKDVEMAGEEPLEAMARPTQIGHMA